MRAKDGRLSLAPAADAGSAMVWALVLALLLGLAGMVLAALASVAVARQRAGAAADLAALAAAGRPFDQVGACALARRVVTAQGASLYACAVRADTAEVTVDVTLSGRLARLPLPPARVRARAGPAEASPRLKPVENPWPRW